MPVRKKSNTNFVAQQPRQGWAYFGDSNEWRRTPHPWGAPGDHFPKDLGDWVAVSKPKGWQPPAGTLAGESLLGAGAAALKLFAEPGGDGGQGAASGPAGAGGHTKIGAGHKPQGYDAHGRYTGPQGGSISMDGGTVRLYANEADEAPDEEEQAGEDGGGEPEAETGAAEEVSQELEGILVADSGRVATDAGGGEAKPPAEVTWKNDEANRDPTHKGLEPQTRETVEKMRTEVPKLESFNVNSGKREGETGPHAEGRAVDINKVNGIPVRDLEKAQGQDGDRARQAAKNMEEQAKKDPNVNQVIGPDGGWNKVGRDKIEPIPPKENKELLDRHKDHYHINVYRR